MSVYIRPRVTGARIFFTVALADRRERPAGARDRAVARGGAGHARRAAVRGGRLGGVAGPPPRGVDVAGGGRGLFGAVERHQGAVHAVVVRRARDGR